MQGTDTGETGGASAERASEAMAGVYDDFTAHHETEGWIAGLLKVVERRGLEGQRLLDVAWSGRWWGCGPIATPGSICESRFEITPDGENAEAGESTAVFHRQRHFPQTDVMAALEGAGLECLDIYGHGLDGVPRQPLDESAHTKAIYIARAARR